MVGGRDRARTGDLMLAKHALSQLSYTPTAGTIINSKAFAANLKLLRWDFVPLRTEKLCKRRSASNRDRIVMRCNNR